MAAVKYTGTSDFRVLSAADAKRAEPPVEDFNKTTWAQGETKSVSDAASEWILRDLSDEFVAGTIQTMTATATSTDEVAVSAQGGDAPSSRTIKSSSKSS